MKNPYEPTPKKILFNKKETEDIFTLRLAWKTDQDPGQFVQVSIPGIGEAPISISSYSKEFIDLSIRKVGNVTNALENLSKGEQLLCRGPYGKGYPMREFLHHNLILIGGGCGVAPLKGVIDYITRERESFEAIYLYLGYRTPNDILYGHKLDEWKEHFHVDVSVDDAPSEMCYTGNVGFITNSLSKSDLAPSHSTVIMCGPPIMMQKSIAILKEKGFTDSQIYVSAERLMYCAFGRCGHCMIRGKYTCVDGPVFRHDEVAAYGL